MLKNKKIILLIVFCLVFFSTNVFATYDVVYNDETISFADLPEDITENTHYIITNYSNKYYCIYYSNDPNFSKFSISSNYAQFQGALNIVSLDFDNNECSSYLRDYKNGIWEGSKSWTAVGPLTSHTVIYSTDNIYNEDGSIFFQVPSQGTLAPIVKEIPIQRTLQEVVQILPLILVVVVSLIGLRKALQMLSTLLHRCLII